ncbi:MAG TPA: YihY/virulence factor BrkB family protein [Candidatus Dormibacteraeota bacterium]|jgi:membrane protein|nr:YihY/virulence factor BrkB family protein [Candidatus Dormibacteraeota bacterium]
MTPIAGLKAERSPEKVSGIIRALGKKLFGTVARVIPQCSMISQAVAFNMFMAFFALLLILLSLMKSSLEGQGGQELAMRLSAILPPGSWQLISENLLRPEVNTWYLATFGWAGMLLVGSQVIKLIIKGIELIYGDASSNSFFGRQIRGLLLFSAASLVWFAAVAMSVFGWQLGRWITPGLGTSPLVHGFWTILLSILAMILQTLVLALIYRFAGSGTKIWSVLPGAAAATILWWGLNLVFGVYVRKTQYGPIYGGLAAAIGLMVWMEFSAILIFLGAAWNAESAAQVSADDRARKNVRSASVLTLHQSDHSP